MLMSLSGSRANCRHPSGAQPRMMASTMPTIFLQYTMQYRQYMQYK